MVRINDKPAYIEKSNIGLFSFLINYDIANIYFIRKKVALENGVYRKIKNGVERQETLSELTSYSNYFNYFRYNDGKNYQNAHDFLLEFHKKIIDGTINY
jgi:hypothetical protein